MMIDEPKKQLIKEEVSINKMINEFFARRRKLNREKYGDKEIPYINIISRIYNEREE